MVNIYIYIFISSFYVYVYIFIDRPHRLETSDDKKWMRTLKIGVVYTPSGRSAYVPQKWR